MAAEAVVAAVAAAGAAVSRRLTFGKMFQFPTYVLMSEVVKVVVAILEVAMAARSAVTVDVAVATMVVITR